MIKLTYTYTCDACGAEKVETYAVQMFNGSKLPHPILPWFWKHVNEVLYCEKHDVTVKVKAKK